jgi:hypothetical protein
MLITARVWHLAQSCASAGNEIKCQTRLIRFLDSRRVKFFRIKQVIGPAQYGLPVVSPLYEMLRLTKYYKPGKTRHITKSIESAPLIFFEVSIFAFSATGQILKKTMPLDDGQEQDIGADDAEHQRHYGKQILQELGALLREDETRQQREGNEDEQYKNDAHAVLYIGIRKACPVWRA